MLYLIFNEGYTASAGEELTAPELSTEAIRLGRLLHRLLPEDTETAGLLALMLLTDARRAKPGRARRANWCRSPSRTGGGGTAASSRRGSS